jgi:hypothetical protein
MPIDLSTLIRAQAGMVRDLADGEALPLEQLRHATAELQATLAEAARMDRLAASVAPEPEAAAESEPEPA